MKKDNVVSRPMFEEAVRKHKAERRARGFSSWGQFVAMLFCQLGGAKSLREITGGLVPAKANCGIWGCRKRLRAPPGLCQRAPAVAVV
jgi:hypothetical protein